MKIDSEEIGHYEMKYHIYPTERCIGMSLARHFDQKASSQVLLILDKR